MGVEKIWDNWYGQNNINHLVATWEFMFEVDWLREFSPLEHRGHDRKFLGEHHAFDLTFWPQCQTSSERINRWEKELGLIHFGHIVATYRWLQQHKGSFEDTYFRILFIRLLIDAYDDSQCIYNVPTITILQKGMTDNFNKVTYLQAETKKNYQGFRDKLQQLIESNILDRERTVNMEENILSFDRHFNYKRKS